MTTVQRCVMPAFRAARAGRWLWAAEDAHRDHDPYGPAHHERPRL